MKTSVIIFSSLILSMLLACSQEENQLNQSVNAVIGDVSYFKTFGEAPDKNIEESLRIKTHLMYVENLLRGRDVSSLSKEKQEKRLEMLNLLNTYWNAGEFPKNYDFQNQRVPCFIDKEGNICAVGYLIEHSSGRELAEEINGKFKYSPLLEMEDEAVEYWIESSGLTKKECAMIQPWYGYAPNVNIRYPYGLSSSLLIGLNLSLNVVNGIHINKERNDWFIPTLGCLSGSAQLILGMIYYPVYDPNTLANVPQQNLSIANIAIGTSTFILSTWNLVSNRKKKKRSFAWNVYGFPTRNKNFEVGFSLSKTL